MRRIVIVGFGSIGRAVVPMLLNEFAHPAHQIIAIAADDENVGIAAEMGITHICQSLTPDNYSHILSRYLSEGDLLLNLSINVSSLALIQWCQNHDIPYLDTCVEPWGKDGRGGYTKGSIETSNAYLRFHAMRLNNTGRKSTAVIAHGMNPGIISHLTKEALLMIARRYSVDTEQRNMTDKSLWSDICRASGVDEILLVEHDTQDDARAYIEGELANTWSAQGFYSEACVQSPEVCVGSTSKTRDRNLQTSFAHMSMLDNKEDWYRKVWTPTGKIECRVVTHHEVVSIAAMFDRTHTPAVEFVYRACEKAMRAIALPERISLFRVMHHDEVQGDDQIGVLIRHQRGMLWHGYKQNSNEARRMLHYNTATSIQVIGGIAGAIRWMLMNPRCGVVEAEDMDTEFVMNTARRYLGKRETIWI